MTIGELIDKLNKLVEQRIVEHSTPMVYDDAEWGQRPVTGVCLAKSDKDSACNVVVVGELY